MGFASLYPSYGLRSGGVVRMQRIVAVHRGLGQQVAVHGAEHVAGGEAFGQVEPVYVECEQAEEVAVHAQVVRRRVRAVVAEPVATHVIATGEPAGVVVRSEEHTSELQSLMRISYAVFCLKNKNNKDKP